MSASFRHGVHPHDHKEWTSHLPVTRLPFGRTYVLPLSQHIGAPSRAVVAAGDRVERGQVVAEPGGFVSVALHAPVTGTVVAIEPRRHPTGSLSPAIVVEADPFSSQRLPHADPVDWEGLSGPDFVKSVQMSGLVGLGGAAFPAHVKYSPPEGVELRHFVVNGAECEPFLTCDHRVMLEHPEAVMGGIRIAAARLGVEESTVGIEANKPDAVASLQGAARAEDRISVRPLHVKYPQGAEKMLIRALYGQEVPAGKLPMELGMVVNNVGTMAALYRWFQSGVPLIERVVTVAGPGIAEPANLLVPLGTPVRDVLEHCGMSEDTELVIMGGPMMGQPLSDLDVPVVKGTSGLLAFTDATSPREYACIRCGRCLEACAEFLNPQLLARLSRHGRVEEMESRAFISDCMECGACTYSCPSGIPIVQLIKAGKAELRRRSMRHQKASL